MPKKRPNKVRKLQVQFPHGTPGLMPPNWSAATPVWEPGEEAFKEAVPPQPGRRAPGSGVRGRRSAKPEPLTPTHPVGSSPFQGLVEGIEYHDE